MENLLGKLHNYGYNVDVNYHLDISGDTMYEIRMTMHGGAGARYMENDLMLGEELRAILADKTLAEEYEKIKLVAKMKGIL